MKMIVGFNFNKISIERKNRPSGNIKVSNDLNITDVKGQDLTINSNKKAIVFDFSFSVTYGPQVAEISLVGSVLYMTDDKKVKDILTQWDKSKKVAPEVSVEVLNLIMRKCNIKALELSQELNLPPHIPMQKIVPKSKASDYIG